jgi:GNAT superfamily N-acetyltransferase
LEVVPIEGPRDLGRFIRFAYSHYKNDPRWVAPLPSDERVRLTPGKNPFFEHGEAAYFMAVDNGRDVGRIAVSFDRNFNSFQNDQQAGFGFFEASSSEAASALLKAVEPWARSKGARVLRGPMSFTSNDEYGLLIDGFDRRPSILMTYNRPEYGGWIEGAGYKKAKDLFEFQCPVPETLPPAYARIARSLRSRNGIHVRPINMKRFKEELGKIKEIYNSAWEKNWGFVPMTDAEIDHMASQLKPAVVPDLVRFAEVDGKTVAVALAIPDVNIALAKVNGKLFPFGIFKLLWTLPRIREYRLMALGITPEWRRKGIAPLLCAELVQASYARGFRNCEIGWTLEDNDPVNDLAVQMGGVKSGTWRIYERPLVA